LKTNEGYFLTPQGDQLYYQYWLPDAIPKAALLVVHGLAEHCGRYMNIVNYFTPLGYAVYGIDHVGHGKSDGTRVYINSFENFIEPLHTYSEMVHAWQPGLPMYLFGHSLGGLIGAIYLLDYQNDLKGAILSSPAIKIPDYVTPPTIVLGKILSTLAPKVGLIGLDARSISRDQTVVQEYINDPLVTTGKTMARLASEMLRSMQRVGAEASKINLPIMIVHGSEDKLINPDASHLLYELVSSQDKTLNIYDGFYHEVFNEPEHDQVFLDMESWLDRQLDQKDNRYENLYQR